MAPQLLRRLLLQEGGWPGYQYPFRAKSQVATSPGFPQNSFGIAIRKNNHTFTEHRRICTHPQVQKGAHTYKTSEHVRN